MNAQQILNRIIAPLLVVTATLASHHALAVSDCGPTPAPSPGGAGPFDYWADKDKLRVVEDFHFTPKVENLREGQSSYLGGDIGYTLGVIPNHARALISMMKLAEREKTNRPHGAKYTVECYFDRAIRFRPKDAMARMIFGMYLAKQGRHDEALQQLEVAKENGEGNANLYYNMGLVYFDLKRYDDSLHYAHEAYQRGFSLPGLKQKLQKAGRWRDLPERKREDEAKPDDEAKADAPGPAAGDTR